MNSKDKNIFSLTKIIKLYPYFRTLIYTRTSFKKSARQSCGKRRGLHVSSVATAKPNSPTGCDRQQSGAKLGRQLCGTIM